MNKNIFFTRTFFLSSVIWILFLFITLILFFSVHGSNFTFFYFFKNDNHLFNRTWLPFFSILFGLIGSIIAGNIFQYTVRNPLASVSTLGILPAVGIGYTISRILIHKVDLWLAFVISFSIIIIILFFMNILNKQKNGNKEIIIIGFSISMFLITCNYLLNLKLPNNNTTFRWINANSESFTKAKLFFGTIVLIPASLVAFIFSKKLTIYKRNPLKSTIVGNNNKLILYGYYILGAFIAIASTIIIGEVAFVGIAIPNITRHILKNDHFILNCVFGFIFILPFGFIAKIMQEFFLVTIPLFLTVISAPIFILFLIGRKPNRRL